MNTMMTLWRGPWPSALVCAAAATLLFFSEASYRRAAVALDDLAHCSAARACSGPSLPAVAAGPAQNEATSMARGRDGLQRTLLLGRIGIACLSVASLLAWAICRWQMRQREGRRQASQQRIQLERERLETQVLERTAQLTELARHVQQALEDERGRIARDLHDELGSLLTAAKLDAARIRLRLAGTAPEALERLAHLVEMLDAGIELKRQIVEELRPSALSTLGLAETLEILAREFAERSGLEVHRVFQEVVLPPGRDIVVYRLVQEAITNISKYAKATRVWVAMALREGVVEVSVRDNGVGFDTASQPRSAYGLVGMRHRVEAEQGTLSVVSSPGRGTLIRMTLPQQRIGAA